MKVIKTDGKEGKNTNVDTTIHSTNLITKDWTNFFRIWKYSSRYIAPRAKAFKSLQYYHLLTFTIVLPARHFDCNKCVLCQKRTVIISTILFWDNIYVPEKLEQAFTRIFLIIICYRWIPCRWYYVMVMAGLQVILLQRRKCTGSC